MNPQPHPSALRAAQELKRLSYFQWENHEAAPTIDQAAAIIHAEHADLYAAIDRVIVCWRGMAGESETTKAINELAQLHAPRATGGKE